MLNKLTALRLALLVISKYVKHYTGRTCNAAHDWQCLIQLKKCSQTKLCTVHAKEQALKIVLQPLKMEGIDSLSRADPQLASFTTMRVRMVQTGGARAALSEKLTSHEQACFLGSSGCFHQSNLSRCTHRMSYQAAADALCCSRFVLTCICRGMQTKQARNPAAALRL